MNLIDFDSFSFANSSINIAISRVKNAARDKKNVLIGGASGTGKSSMALYYHHLNYRDRQVMFVDAGNIQIRSLSEQISKLQIKTIVLENIERLSGIQQQELLLSLPSWKSQVIATSTVSIRDLSVRGSFNVDLLERLSQVAIELPELKDRREDMIELVSFMLDVFSILHGTDRKRLTDKALDQLLEYAWPGNIRELESVLERSFLASAEKAIRPEDLRFQDQKKIDGVMNFAGLSLSEVEKRLILQTLELTLNNKSKAAQILGISIRTLRNKLNEYKEAGELI